MKKPKTIVYSTQRIDWPDVKMVAKKKLRLNQEQHENIKKQPAVRSWQLPMDHNLPGVKAQIPDLKGGENSTVHWVIIDTSNKNSKNDKRKNKNRQKGFYQEHQPGKRGPGPRL